MTAQTDRTTLVVHCRWRGDLAGAVGRVAMEKRPQQAWPGAGNVTTAD